MSRFATDQVVSQYHRDYETLVEVAAREGCALPNFMIVGAAKAGTTSLYEYLRQHPDVFMSENKEPCYFIENKYGISDATTYCGLFRAGRGKKRVGEASTPYLSSPESAGLIRRTLGEPKIIIMLRNPARRAFSMYAWMTREGWEGVSTFEDALRLEPQRIGSESFARECPQFSRNYYYFDSGLYAGQVRRYVDAFGWKNVMLILFEEFVSTPARTCKEVFRFLGLRDEVEPRIQVYNESGGPRCLALQYFLRTHQYKPFPHVPRRLWISAIDRLAKWNISYRRKPLLAPATYRELVRRYVPDIHALETLTNRDFSCWYGDVERST